MVSEYAARSGARPVTHRDPRLALPVSAEASHDEGEDGLQHHDDDDEQQHDGYGDEAAAELDVGEEEAGEGEDELVADSLAEHEHDEHAEHDDHDDEDHAAYEESMLEEGEPVQVAVRCRPLLSNELMYAGAVGANSAGGSPSALASPSAAASGHICVHIRGNQVLLGKERVFEFDHAYGPDATQQQVYEGCAAGLVRAAFKGYNATILAYGQTGSGKTYTMLNPGGGPSSLPSSASQQGLIPRVVHDLYARVNLASARGVTVTTKVSYVEIYQEELYDLLGRGSAATLAATSNNTAGFGRGTATVSSGISIREEAGGGVVLTGVKEEVVSSYADIARALTRGTASRTTGSTRMNVHSSRSHCIFTINIEQRRTGGMAATQSGGKSGRAARKDEVLKSKFHLVDLAGSERAKRTGAQGVRFQESVHINRGLMALALVIQALVTPGKEKHVPYRDSKLTRLLQSSLGGNSRTLMLACVSGHDSNFEETHTTLKYASRARRIRNRAVVNVREELVPVVPEPSPSPVAPATAAGAASSASSTVESAVAAVRAESEADLGRMRLEIARLHEALATARDGPSRGLGAGNTLTDGDGEGDSSFLPAFVDGEDPSLRHLGLARAYAALSSLFSSLRKEHSWLLSGLGFFSSTLTEMNELEAKRDKVKEQVIQLRKQYDALLAQPPSAEDEHAAADHAAQVSDLSSQIKAAQKSYVTYRDLLAKLREDLDAFLQIYAPEQMAALAEEADAKWDRTEPEGPRPGVQPQEEMRFAQRVHEAIANGEIVAAGSGESRRASSAGDSGAATEAAQSALRDAEASLSALQSEHASLKSAFDEAQADLRFDDEIFEEKVKALRAVTLRAEEAEAQVHALKQANEQIKQMMEQMQEEVRRKLGQQQQAGGLTARSERPSSASPAAAAAAAMLGSPSKGVDGSLSQFRDRTATLAQMQEEGDEVLTAAEEEEEADGGHQHQPRRKSLSQQQQRSAPQLSAANQELVSQLRNQYAQLLSQLSSLRAEHSRTESSRRGLGAHLSSRKNAFLSQQQAHERRLRDLRIQAGMKRSALADVEAQWAQAKKKLADRSRLSRSQPGNRSAAAGAVRHSRVPSANARALAEAEQHYAQLEQDLALKQRLLAALSPRSSLSSSTTDVRAGILDEVHALEQQLKQVGAHLESIHLGSETNTPNHSPPAPVDAEGDEDDLAAATAAADALQAEVSSARAEVQSLLREEESVQAALTSLTAEYAPAREHDKATAQQLDQELQREAELLTELEQAREELAAQLRELGVDMDTEEGLKDAASAHDRSQLASDRSHYHFTDDGGAGGGHHLQINVSTASGNNSFRFGGDEQNTSNTAEQSMSRPVTALYTAVPPQQRQQQQATDSSVLLSPTSEQSLRRKAQWASHQVRSFLVEAAEVSALYEAQREAERMESEARRLADEKKRLLSQSLRASSARLPELAELASEALQSGRAPSGAKLNQSLATLDAHMRALDKQSSSLLRQSQSLGSARGGSYNKELDAMQHELEQLGSERARMESARQAILAQLRPGTGSSSDRHGARDLLVVDGPLLSALLTPEDAAQLAALDEQLDDLQAQIGYKQERIEDMKSQAMQQAQKQPHAASTTHKPNAATAGHSGVINPTAHRAAFLSKLQSMFDVRDPREAAFLAHEYASSLLEHAQSLERAQAQLSAAQHALAEKDLHLSEMERSMAAVLLESDQRAADMQREFEVRAREIAAKEAAKAEKRIKQMEQDMLQRQAEMMHGQAPLPGSNRRESLALPLEGDDQHMASSSKSPVQKLQTLKMHMHHRQSQSGGGSNGGIAAANGATVAAGGHAAALVPAHQQDQTHLISQRAFSAQGQGHGYGPPMQRSFTPSGLPGHSTLGGRPSQTPLLYNQSPSTTPRNSAGLGTAPSTAGSNGDGLSPFESNFSSAAPSARGHGATSAASTRSHASEAPTSPARSSARGSAHTGYVPQLSPASLRHLAASQQERLQYHQQQQHPSQYRSSGYDSGSGPASASNSLPTSGANSRLHSPKRGAGSQVTTPAAAGSNGAISPPLSAEDKAKAQLALLKRKQSLRSSQLALDRAQQAELENAPLADARSPSAAYFDAHTGNTPGAELHDDVGDDTDGEGDFTHSSGMFSARDAQHQRHLSAQQQQQRFQQQRPSGVPQLKLSAAQRQMDQHEHSYAMQQQHHHPPHPSTVAAAQARAPVQQQQQHLSTQHLRPKQQALARSTIGRVERTISPSPSAR